MDKDKFDVRLSTIYSNNNWEIKFIRSGQKVLLLLNLRNLFVNNTGISGIIQDDC